MGDFDRRESAGKKNESKKLVMVGILGALLLGLVVFQFNKKSPEAMAGPVAGSNGGGQPAAIEQTPEQAMALLARDPTSGLLDTKSLTSVAAAPPRNPFVMDAAWRETFAKHIDAPNPQKNTNLALPAKRTYRSQRRRFPSLPTTTSSTASCSGETRSTPSSTTRS